MRRVVAIFGLMLAIGSANATTGAPTVAAALAGTWSFDGTCASGDGMTLRADGKASYDEWGEGLWALAEKGARIVIIAEDISEEVDRRKVAELVEFRIASRGGNKMALVRLSDGVKIDAVKCPAQ